MEVVLTGIEEVLKNESIGQNRPAIDGYESDQGSSESGFEDQSDTDHPQQKSKMYLQSENQHIIPTQQNSSPISQQTTDITQEIKDQIEGQVPKGLPLISSGYSLKPDMMFGWKPKEKPVNGAPIPLYYDYEEFDDPVNKTTGELLPILYLGWRPANTLIMHRELVKTSKYQFKFPTKQLDVAPLRNRQRGPEEPRDFEGVNLKIKDNLQFDSKFECGNLDMVARVNQNEYDLYMRVDANTRGHHQWFYFMVKNIKQQKVKFNIVNFTKPYSLYNQGMRINTLSSQQKKVHDKSTGWDKSGENIKYKLSKISKQIQYGNDFKIKKYYCLSFTYEFKHDEDQTYFAFCYPYTFSTVQRLARQIYEKQNTLQEQFVQTSVLCKSLSGIDVPLLTVTSRVKEEDYNVIQNTTKYKKFIIVSARVHPGETSGSWMMQGFIKYITGDSQIAQELRDKIVFKVIPMSNPDGVVLGNYRSSLSGNDLNRKFQMPDFRLNPTVVAIKDLCSEIIKIMKGLDDDPILSFIDMHGHSKKKNVFAYGPYYPLHNDRYLRMRILPKLIADNTEMFRFYSCKFRIEKSKLRAARIVLWKEFNIMNCFTLEASFHGYINKERETIEFTTSQMEEVGEKLGESFHQYIILMEQDEKQRKQREQNRKKKKKQPKKIEEKKRKRSDMTDSSGVEELDKVGELEE